MHIFSARKGSRRRFIKREKNDGNLSYKQESDINGEKNITVSQLTDTKQQRNQQNAQLIRYNTFDGSLLYSCTKPAQHITNPNLQPRNDQNISENIFRKNENNLKSSAELYDTFNHSNDDSINQLSRKSHSLYTESYHPPNPNNSVTHVSRSPLLLRKTYPEPSHPNTTSHPSKQCFSPESSQRHNFMDQSQQDQKKKIPQMNLLSKNINYLRSSSKSPNPFTLNQSQHTKSTRSMSPSFQNQNYMQTAHPEQPPQNPYSKAINIPKNPFCKQSSVSYDENSYKFKDNCHAKRNGCNPTDDIDAEFEYNKKFVVKPNEPKSSSKVYSDESKRNSLYENLNKQFSSSTSLNNLSNYNNNNKKNKSRIVAPYMMGVFDPSSNFLFNQKYSKNGNTKNYTEEKMNSTNLRITENPTHNEIFSSYGKPNTDNKLISSTNFVITNQIFPSNLETPINRPNYSSLPQKPLDQVPSLNLFKQQSTEKNLDETKDKYNLASINHSPHKTGVNQNFSHFSEVSQKQSSAKHIKKSSWNECQVHAPATIKDTISKKHSLDNYIGKSYVDSKSPNTSQNLQSSEANINQEVTNSNVFHHEKNELLLKNEVIQKNTESDKTATLNAPQSNLEGKETLSREKEIDQKKIFSDKIVYTKQVMFKPQKNEFPIENLKVITTVPENSLEKPSARDGNIAAHNGNRFVSSIQLPTFNVSALDAQKNGGNLIADNLASSNSFLPVCLKDKNLYKNTQNVNLGNKQQEKHTTFTNASSFKLQPTSQASPHHQNQIPLQASKSLNLHSSIDSEVPSTTTIDSSSILNVEDNQNLLIHQKTQPKPTSSLLLKIGDARKNIANTKNFPEKLNLEKSYSNLPDPSHTEQTMLKHQDSFNDPDSPTLKKTLPLPKDSVILYHRRTLTRSASQTSSTSSSEEEAIFRHLTPIQRRKFQK